MHLLTSALKVAQGHNLALTVLYAPRQLEDRNKWKPDLWNIFVKEDGNGQNPALAVHVPNVLDSEGESEGEGEGEGESESESESESRQLAHQERQHDAA